jgi:hypothetical protein
MDHATIQITYIGGPTAILEMGDARLLTDPTFDPGGSAYTTPVYTLHKSLGPAVAADAIGSELANRRSHSRPGSPWTFRPRRALSESLARAMPDARERDADHSVGLRQQLETARVTGNDMASSHNCGMKLALLYAGSRNSST